MSDTLDLEASEYTKKFSQEKETKQFQQQVGKFRFVFILIASQLQGLAGAFKKKDAAVSSWLYWAGQAIFAFINNAEVPTEPSGVDSFNSPLSDSLAGWFLTVGFQLRSLGAAIGMYDADDLGTDDRFAHLLQRVSSVLITLGNK